MAKRKAATKKDSGKVIDDTIQEMREMMKVDTWTEEEMESFMTEGGRVCETEGIVTLQFYVNAEVEQALSPKEKALQLLRAAWDYLRDDMSLVQLTAGSVSMRANEYTEAASAVASGELIEELKG